MGFQLETGHPRHTPCLRSPGSGRLQRPLSATRTPGALALVTFGIMKRTLPAHILSTETTLVTRALHRTTKDSGSLGLQFRRKVIGGFFHSVDHDHIHFCIERLLQHFFQKQQVSFDYHISENMQQKHRLPRVFRGAWQLAGPPASFISTTSPPWPNRFYAHPWHGSATSLFARCEEPLWAILVLQLRGSCGSLGSGSLRTLLP